MKLFTTALFILFTTVVVAQSNMPKDRVFTSKRQFFSLNYPDGWNVYENPNGTYHFEKVNAATGEFEIKESRAFSDSNEVMHYLDNESFSHPNAKYQYNENKTILSYNSLLLIEGKETMVFVWLVASNNTVLTCRYLVDNKLKTAPKTQTELMEVNLMIQSIIFK